MENGLQGFNKNKVAFDVDRIPLSYKKIIKNALINTENDIYELNLNSFTLFTQSHNLLSSLKRYRQFEKNHSKIKKNKKKILTAHKRKKDQLVKSLNLNNLNALNLNIKNVANLSKRLSDSISVEDIPEKIFKIFEDKKYSYCQIIVHEKGNSFGQSIFRADNTQDQEQIKTSHFNKLFQHVLKSKSESFEQTTTKSSLIKCNGYFMAKSFTFQFFRLIIILSNNSFLADDTESLTTFNDRITLIGPFVNNLSIQNTNLKKFQLFRKIFKTFPLPLSVEEDNKIIFSNYKFSSLKKLKPIENKLSKTKILRTYPTESSVSDIFHYHRINLLGELINTLRHELSNPLFGISLSCEYLTTTVKSPFTSKTLSQIKDSVNRCQLIINNFYGLYSDETGSKKCNLNSIIVDTFTLAKSELREIKTNITFQGIPETYEIFTNPTWLSQILFNLIINSAQSLNQSEKKGKSISVNVLKSVPQKAIIEVIDNGIGVKKDFENKLFDPFYTTKSEGTGLGLSICKILL